MTLTSAEVDFLAALVHELCREPFGGPATKAVQKLGLLPSQLTWLYKRYVNQQNDRGLYPGHPAAADTVIPWNTPDQALRRNEEAKCFYQ